jgi:acetolactate synthase-1/2/3 large subunit
MTAGGRATAGGDSVAHLVAEYLAAQGVRQVFGLCGGHIQPLWDALDRRGVAIVGVRHEGSAVHMAHAAAETTGRLGVALVTAGPGVTNAVTAVANASVARVPVLVVSGRTPRPQSGMGAMQDVPQATLLAPLCRRTEAVSERRHVLSRLDAVLAAVIGEDGPPGPGYIDFPVDLFEEAVVEGEADRRHLQPLTATRRLPDPAAVSRAADLLRSARRPLVIAGRSALGARQELLGFLAATDALYVDTGESRGALPDDHPAKVPAMRARVMREADVVVTLGRRLDFQLAYGSPRVFSPAARFLRVGRTVDETDGTRRADVSLRSDTDLALAALTAANVTSTALDDTWLGDLRSGNASRVAGLAQQIATEPDGADGRMHPYRLIEAVNHYIDERTVVVADGGDILSFARVALRAPTYLDCGAFGCLGVGVPFANGAALATPGRPVVAVIGDGSIGFTVMEVDTAVRHGADVLFVVANNEAWNIERHDQLSRYRGNLVGVELPGCRYDLVARGLGAHAERVESHAELGPALDRAMANLPALVDVAVTRDAVSPDFLSGLASVPAYHAVTAWDTAERTG